MFIALAHLLPLIAIAVAQNASDSADTNATSATPSRTAEETPTTSYTGLPPSLRVNTAPLPSLTDGPYVSIPGPTPYTATVPAWGAFWSYSQPPIPSTTVTSDPAVFTAALGDEVSIAQPPQVREYNFTIDYAAGWPSGFLRRMIVVNNQFPGPLIEANQGDEIVVHVQNNLPTGQSIHWHGMRQNGTSVMDGVAGFSQCPIPPGGNYTYRFKTDGEFGTYWYHSHFGNTLSDGLLGALIIHSKDDPLKKGRDFDDDRIVYLSDWMNDDSTVIIENQSDMEKPYRGIRFVAEPDAVLINGNGQSDCDKAQRGVPCGENAVTEIKAAQGSQVRLRLINHGGQAQIRFSIDGHWLRVIEADDTPVESVWLKEISVGAGQRYSVVVKLDQGEVGSSFWIRAKVATWCMNPLATVDGVGILRYTDQQGEHAGVDEPCSTPWPDLADPHTAVCRDLDQDYPLVPLIKEDAPSDARESVVLDNLFGVFANPTTQKQMIGYGVNGVMYKNHVNNPLLGRVTKGEAVGNDEITSATFTGDGSADIILNNLDPPPFGHPFHLHGRPFHIIARGSGNATADVLTSGNTTFVNPLRRDTLVIPESSYAVIRVKLDDPGVWPLHCHIGWHLASGKMAAIIVRPNDVRQQYFPPEWAALCNGTDVNEIGPGRRAYPALP